MVSIRFVDAGSTPQSPPRSFTIAGKFEGAFAARTSL
jgi:hypothetical protein